MKKQALHRTVYLPEGDWYNFQTNKRYEGGKLISISAPLDTLPLFVKSGTVLPMWPVMHFMRERPIETLILRVYADSGETIHYEDAGEGLGYQQGDFRWVTYRCMETSNTLTIERTVEGTYTPSYSAIELQVVGASQAITTVEIDGKAVSGLHHDNRMMTVTIHANFNQVKVGI
jgi:alpha-glucosidase